MLIFNHQVAQHLQISPFGLHYPSIQLEKKTITTHNKISPFLQSEPVHVLYQRLVLFKNLND